jgi:hypothetical protein
MTILGDIIKEFGENELTLQVKKICQEIHNEEIKKCKHPERLPTGPNTFLSIEIPGIKKSNQVSYLSLEREGEEHYLTVLWSLYSKFYLDETKNLKKIKVWEINENKAEKILIQFAKTVKLLRGE